MTISNSPNPDSSFTGRVLRRLCTQRERRWIDALLAESVAVPGGPARLSWLAGAVTFIGGSLLNRAGAAIEGRAVAAATLATVGLLVSSLAFRAGYEGLPVDDDIYLALSGIFGVAILRLSIVIRAKRSS